MTLKPNETDSQTNIDIEVVNIFFFVFSIENVLRQHSRVDSLLSDCLPCPALALLHNDVLATSSDIIVRMFLSDIIDTSKNFQGFYLDGPGYKVASPA